MKYDEFKFYLDVTIPNGVQALIILPDNTQHNETKQGKYTYVGDIPQNIIAPYSVDTPIFEILENENATNVLKEIVPYIYNSAISETVDALYDTVRHYCHFNGISQETVDRCQEELAKVKVLNYSSPDDDIPTDEPIEPTEDTDDDHSKSNLMKFNYLVFGLFIILIYF